LKIVVIQTAFLGDVVLMTSLLESIALLHPNAHICVVVKSECAHILANNPHVLRVYGIDKREKWKALWRAGNALRTWKPNVVINCHRFLSSGLLALALGARQVVGFQKNPLSIFFTKRVGHCYGPGVHELDRNHALLLALWPRASQALPRLYPHPQDYEAIEPLCQGPFQVLAPGSVWFTKQYPLEGWIRLLDSLETPVVVVGGQESIELGKELAGHRPHQVKTVCGELTLLQSAALISRAIALYANDSAPTHLGTAMGTPTHTVYCSTVPDFGFGPKAPGSQVHQTAQDLACRPCGLHGHHKCPQGHFNCSKFSVRPSKIVKLT
jgi:heptosyltransferase-2